MALGAECGPGGPVHDAVRLKARPLLRVFYSGGVLRAEDSVVGDVVLLAVELGAVIEPALDEADISAHAALLHGPVRVVRPLPGMPVGVGGEGRQL